MPGSQMEDVYVAVRSLLKARLASPSTREQAARVLAAIEKEAVVRLVYGDSAVNGDESTDGSTKGETSKKAA